MLRATPGRALKMHCQGNPLEEIKRAVITQQAKPDHFASLHTVMMIVSFVFELGVHPQSKPWNVNMLRLLRICVFP